MSEESNKFERSKDFYINGIDPQGLEIYTYGEFANIIRAKIKYTVKAQKQKVSREKNQKKKLAKLLDKLNKLKG